ncbi:DUF2167 domain-containing protein [Roseateles violae]|uniref:DUF2167 domain-containing protein n=1 Tax=Roseateles violae TaxID=3058042 RepID=A0ABT8DTL9_9BURK|nr:DUF2167 domain-containing protein [Pelomonas sp. PFR6]MDN3919664.1 DUF2167 domain-containing protein [Pelomonas sp. PFR6]
MIEKKMQRLAAALLMLALSALAMPARAMSPDERKAVFEEADKAAVHGPKDIALAQQAVLHLPAGRIFVPQPQAARVVLAMGNPGEFKTLQGLVFPESDTDKGWFAVVEYHPSGYIKDDDAKNWNADEMLQSFREGTEAQNAERKKVGVTEMEIVGWAEKPAYEAATHRLVWAIGLRDKGAPAEADQGVNYNTYALGREGYLSLNLVTDLKDLGSHKGEAQTLLGALELDAGKRYGDFNASTDHVAEYGVAALVLGVGAKKLGLLAVVFAFVAKFAKVIFLALAGFGAVFARLFKRKNANIG